MIGFKTIDDYTFDDCVNYLNTHNDSDENWHEITGRYTMLLRQLEREDDRLFLSCRTIDDFKKYLSHLPALGTQLYRRKHTKEAKEAIDKILAAQKKKNKRATVVGLLLGLIVGLLSLRYLFYLVAYLIGGANTTCVDVFLTSSCVLFILFIIVRFAKKKITCNRYIAFFGGILISGILLGLIGKLDWVCYGEFSHYGICRVEGLRPFGVVDCLGNTIVPKEKYDCFYETDNYIVGVTTNNSGSLSIIWYEKGGRIIPVLSKHFWIVDDNNTSLSLKDAIERERGPVVSKYYYNSISVVTRDGKDLYWKDSDFNYWHDPEILELRVIEK